MKKKKQIYYLTLTAIFSAMAFVGTMINIPLPSGGMVHLGNFVMILAGLLCGGIVGGLSGSIGMGLYDIFAGYNPSTYIRSFILKFFVGFLVGSLFRLLIKKKLKITALLYVLGGVFLCLAVLGSVMLGNMMESGFVVHLFGASKTIQKIDLILAVVFSYLFTIGFVLAGIFSYKFKYGQKCALFSTTIAMVFNMIFELILRTFLTHWLDGVDLPVAYATALAKIPASILTSFITVVLITLIYGPVYKATKNYNAISDLEVEL